LVLILRIGHSFQVRPVDFESLEPAADVSAGCYTLSAPKMVFNFKKLQT